MAESLPASVFSSRFPRLTPAYAIRRCGGVERVQTLSDYRDHSFGIATGTRIEELGLLTRAVFLAGHDGKLAYVEYVPEITNHPDYDAALDAMRALSK